MIAQAARPVLEGTTLILTSLHLVLLVPALLFRPASRGWSLAGPNKSSESSPVEQTGTKKPLLPWRFSKRLALKLNTMEEDGQ